MKRLYSIIFAILLALPILAEPADTFATAIRGRIDALLQNDIFDRTQLGLYVYDLTADEPLYDHGSRQCMRPASCQKIMTAATALHELGADYNYQTRLYVADTTQVIIRGGMDPMIGYDDLKAFTRALKEYGMMSIPGDIICDVTFKDTAALGWGWCWDDDMTPLTPLLYQGRATFENHFRQALREAGISFNGRLIKGRVPHDATLLVTRTHTIEQILHPMMKQSNNLYAESLFYQLGAKSGRAYASHKDAAAHVNQFIDLCERVIDHYQIADGSGVSLYNYLTPEVLVDALRYVFKHEDIFHILYSSLPVMGRDGTLHRRCKGTSAQDRVHAKTGTLEGVSSLAGYALAPNGHQLAFAIINQGIRHSATGKNFQDRVCQALTRPLSLPTIEPDSIADPADSEIVPDSLDLQRIESEKE